MVAPTVKTYGSVPFCLPSADHVSDTETGKVTCIANVRDYYADSSIRPVTNHVGRPMLHGKIREQLQDKLSDTDEDAKVQVVVGLR